MAMTREEVYRRIRELDGSDTSGLQGLGRQIATESRDAPRALVGQWTGRDEQQAAKAGFVVLELEELAMASLLDRFDGSSLTRRVQYMSAVVDTQLQLRQRIVKQLDRILDDRTVLAAGSSAPATPPDRSKRTCDEVYLLGRRVVLVDESLESGFSSEGDFMQLTHDERNSEIRRWRRSRPWRTALSYAEGTQQ
jgi:hypothetical protein